MVPDRHGERDLGQLLEHAAWAKTFRQVFDVIDQCGIGVLLGDRGTGKTQMAVELVRMVVAQRERARYVRAAKIFMDIRKAFREDGGITEEQAIAIYTAPHLLVIDEGQERRHNEFENTHLTLIVDERYGMGKPTLFLANSDRAKFRTQVGESIWDRMCECGGVWLCTWPSFRTAKDT